MSAKFVAKRATILFFAPVLSKGSGLLLATVVLAIVYPTTALLLALAFFMVNGAAIANIYLIDLRRQYARSTERSRTHHLIANSIFLFFRPLINVVIFSTLLAGVFLLIINLNIAVETVIIIVELAGLAALFFWLPPQDKSESGSGREGPGSKGSWQANRMYEDFARKWRSEAEEVPATCILHSSIISTPFGGRRASDLKIGMPIVSWNAVDKVFEVDHIVRVMDFGPTGVVELTLSDRNKLCVTETHAVLCAGRWITARRVSVGDSLGVMNQNGLLETRTVEARRTAKAKKVLSFGTENNHTLVVDGVITHNMTYFRELRTTIMRRGEFRQHDWIIGGRSKRRSGLASRDMES